MHSVVACSLVETLPPENCELQVDMQQSFLFFILKHKPAKCQVKAKSYKLVSMSYKCVNMCQDSFLVISAQLLFLKRKDWEEPAKMLPSIL